MTSKEGAAPRKRRWQLQVLPMLLFGMVALGIAAYMYIDRRIPDQPWDHLPPRGMAVLAVSYPSIPPHESDALLGATRELAMRFCAQHKDGNKTSIGAAYKFKGFLDSGFIRVEFLLKKDVAISDVEKALRVSVERFLKDHKLDVSVKARALFNSPLSAPEK